MRILSTAAAVTLCSFCAPAMADVTPAQVWDDFEAYLEGFGYVVDGQETATGDGLEITDLTLTVEMPEDSGTLSVSVGQITLLDNGDGTVLLTYPEIVPVALSLEEDGEVVEMVINAVHDGLEMIVSGDSGALSYDYSAESIGVSLASLIVDGEVVPREEVRFDMTAAPVAGSSQSVLSDGLREIAQEGNFGDLTYSIVANVDESPESAVISGTLAGVTFEGTGALPTDMDMADMAAAMAAGFAVEGGFAHEGGTVEFSVIEDGATTNGQTSSGSGYLNLSMNSDAIRYAIGGTEATFAMSGPDLPLPVSASIEETRFDILVPLGAPGVMQEARLGVTLAGLTVPELLWNMFDPGAALPRDPATLVLDLTAMVTPFVSVFDEEAMAALGDEAPAEVNAVTLEGLELSVAGGSITGDGAVVFDNSDLETFDGFPRPEGRVNLQVSGANALIDSLIAMGLVAEGDAMGVRMMLSMFTVPGSAPDTATSTLEITPEGQVLANGQRIR